MKILARNVLLTLALLMLSTPALAQSRPLVTEDPETVPAGYILFEAGLDFLNSATFPASGLAGNLLRIGTFGLSFGVSSIAEIQIDGGLSQRLAIKTIDPAAPLNHMYTGGPTATSGFEDLSVGAKIRFLSETETRPALAVRFTTRLPLVGNENGLGLDTTDFSVALAAAKTVRSVRVAANLGLGILGDPTRGDEQNRVVIYGVSVAQAVAPGAELVGELNGRVSTGDATPPPGTESRVVARVGGRFTRGPVRLDAGALLGVTNNDPSWGLTAGITWVFKGFNVK